MKVLKSLIAGVAIALAGAFCAFADETPQAQGVGPFSGLYTNVSQEAIPAQNSPDLINVDITQGGKSVKKREGYGRDVTLTISTSAVHNLYKFYDSSGNEVRLAFNDRNVSSSINGAAWTSILSTGVVTGASWDCTDYLGFAYCDSNSFDVPIKTNGTTAGTTSIGGPNGAPSGSLIASTGDRLLIGATSANPSRISYSVSASLSDFTLGTQNSSGSFEDINAPGSKLTHLAFRYGRWLWWKDQSFGFVIGTGQLDLQIVTVSNTIGTFDNTDVYDAGITYFRGSDSHFYAYDGNVLRRVSNDIGPTVKSANRRKSNFWTQTSQSDFQAGSSTPTTQISTTISPGDVTVSSFSVVENSSAQWNSGTSSNLSVNPSSITLSTNNSGTVNNNDFESAFTGTWNDPDGLCLQKTTQSAVNCTLNPKNSSNFAFCGDVNLPVYSFEIVDVSSNVLGTSAMPATSDCTYRQIVVSSAAITGRRVKFRFKDKSNSNTSYFLTSQSYIFGGSISFWYANGNTNSIYLAVDLIQSGSSTITSGNYTSKVYDTNFTSSTFKINAFNYTANTSTPSFSLLTSTNSTGPWASILTSSGPSAVGNRYAMISTTISITNTDDALTSISSFTLLSRSTGSYFSAVFNAPNFTSWGEFIANASSNGGSIAYFTRASTASFNVLSTTPTWVAQSNNSLVSASTGTYMQAKADFALTAATQTPTLNDFQLNWFEGSAADRMYGTYFDNSLWFSVSLGTTSTTNNRILKYDLLNQTWVLYDIAANGFLTYGNNLYFGSPTIGNIYEYGQGVTSDSGTAINAYWKSKAFFGDSPFTDKDLRVASWYMAESSGAVLTMNYTINESTTVSKTINLYSSTKNLIQDNWNFPIGSVATNFNVQFGDNSTNPRWEVFGGLVMFVPKPWKVSP